MSPSLDGCREKITRAHEQRKVLNGELRRFISGHPYRVTTDVDRNKSKGFLKLEIVEPPPPRFGVLIGEIVHNLRSALDHLCFALAEVEQGDAPHPVPYDSPWAGIQFPITDKLKLFKRAVARGRLWGLHPDDVADIERLQPYHGGEHPPPQITFLRELSNIDKHRRLHLVAGMLFPAESYIREIKGRDCLISDVEVPGASGPLEDGATLAEFRVHVTGPHPQVYVEHNFVFDVAFGEGPIFKEWWPIDLEGILVALNFEVAGIVEGFASRVP